MPKFRKKPVVIEAELFTNSEPLPFQQDGAPCQFNGDRWFIETLEGEMRLSKGDYVIKGVNGEFYPCKPDIFEKTYEAVDKFEFDDTSQCPALDIPHVKGATDCPYCRFGLVNRKKAETVDVEGRAIYSSY